MGKIIFQKENYKGYVICIVPDDTPENPRHFESNIGTIISWHKKGNYGDIQPSENRLDYLTNVMGGSTASVYGYDITAILKAFANYGVILPVYMLDHSGLALKTSPFVHDPMDSGLLGYIYVSWDDVKEKALDDHTKENIEALLKLEIEIYGEYLNGEVYGYEIYKEGDDNEARESSWGFYGMDFENNGLLESAKEKIDNLIKE